MGLLSERETRFGTCQWCERHNVVLEFVLGQHDGRIWSGWICGKCLEEVRNEQVRKPENRN